MRRVGKNTSQLFFSKKQSHTLIFPAMQAYDSSGSELSILIKK